MHRSTFSRLIVFVLSLSCSTLALANAGLLHFVRGEVSATDSQGNLRNLNKGDIFSAGDTINTGKGALAQLKFTDGALVSLQPNSSFRVDEYTYNGTADGSEKGSFSLLQGGMRTITGAVGKQNRNNYKVNAVIATIGIRGTEYTAQLDDPKETLLVHTGDGLIEVCNSAGCILLASGETGRINNNQEPQRTAFRPQLPAPGLAKETSTTLFSSSEQRTPQGNLLALAHEEDQPHSPPVTPPVTPPVITDIIAPSDGNYVSAVAGDAGFPISIYGETSLSVDANHRAQSLVSNDLLLSAESVNTANDYNATDGVLTWGIWAQAHGAFEGETTPVAYDNFSYVVGKPATSAELLSLGNTSASFNFIGGTLHSSAASQVALNGIALDLAFGGGAILSSSMQVNFTLNGASYNVSGSGGQPSGFVAHFYGAGSQPTPYSPHLSYQGFVGGTNASHAGVAFRIENINPASAESLTGAAAFRR